MLTLCVEWAVEDWPIKGLDNREMISQIWTAECRDGFEVLERAGVHSKIQHVCPSRTPPVS